MKCKLRLLDRPVAVINCRGKGFINNLIRWQTRSDYSHTAIFCNGKIYESVGFVGVRVTDIDDWDVNQDMDIYPLYISNPAAILKMEDFLKSQLGKRYDWSSLFRFVSRCQETRASKGKWFCSELVFVALQKAGFKVLERINPWEVSPSMISKSTVFKIQQQTEIRISGKGNSIKLSSL